MLQVKLEAFWRDGGKRVLHSLLAQARGFGVFVSQSCCFGCFLVMRSAFTELRAIREDQIIPILIIVRWVVVNRTVHGLSNGSIN
jgi:hypothetical protein